MTNYKEKYTWEFLSHTKNLLTILVDTMGHKVATLIEENDHINQNQILVQGKERSRQR